MLRSRSLCVYFSNAANLHFDLSCCYVFVLLASRFRRPIRWKTYTPKSEHCMLPFICVKTDNLHAFFHSINVKKKRRHIMWRWPAYCTSTLHYTSLHIRQYEWWTRIMLSATKQRKHHRSIADESKAIRINTRLNTRIISF